MTARFIRQLFIKIAHVLPTINNCWSTTKYEQAYSNSMNFNRFQNHIIKWYIQYFGLRSKRNDTRSHCLVWRVEKFKHLPNLLIFQSMRPIRLNIHWLSPRPQTNHTKLFTANQRFNLLFFNLLLHATNGGQTKEDEKKNRRSFEKNKNKIGNKN